MNLSVVIVAAGSGRRFGSKEPKQFLTLNKKPMFLWSVLAFKKKKTVNKLFSLYQKRNS
jgi:2-C-methyl-D-erythritol 4-phosphate cytidylyltransferase